MAIRHCRYIGPMPPDNPPTDTADDSLPDQTTFTRIVRGVAVASLLCMCVSILLYLYGGWRAASLTSSACLLLFLLTGQRFIGLRERLLLVLAFIVTAGAVHMAPDLDALAERSLRQAAFLASFMLLVALLREGAITSPSVLAVGHYLANQPPGRRYLSIHIGSHLMGVILNFGALSLLGPLIQRGAAAQADNPAVAAIREQRQMSALTRGFSWVIAWTPTAVAQALVAAVVVGSQPGKIALMGVSVAVAILGVGWLEDRFRGQRARADLARQHQVVASVKTPFPGKSILQFSGVFLSLAALTILLVWQAGVTVVVALMLAAPAVMIIWVFLQNRHDAPGTSVKRLKQTATESMPGGAPEAVTLAIAGYCGIMAAGLTDARVFADFIGLTALHPLAVYLLVAAIIPIASNAALPPMLMVTFLGSLFSALPNSGLDPTLLGLSFVLGWTLNLTASPFGATALVLGRVTGIKGTTLSWRWNGFFSLAAYGVIAVALVIFSSL